MKISYLPILSLAAIVLSGCDAQVNVPPAENKTTIVTPGEKKTEHNTTIVNPQAPAAEKKTESTTVTTPGGTTTQKTTETKQ